MPPDTMPTVLVNFSHVEEDGLLFAGLDDASAHLAVGMEVLASDEEDHECRATVERVEEPLVFLAPDWGTWRRTESAEALQGGTVTVVTSHEFAFVPVPPPQNGVEAEAHDSQSANVVVS